VDFHDLKIHQVTENSPCLLIFTHLMVVSL
jgi:hypothetical protein